MKHILLLLTLLSINLKSQNIQYGIFSPPGIDGVWKDIHSNVGLTVELNSSSHTGIIKYNFEGKDYYTKFSWTVLFDEKNNPKLLKDDNVGGDSDFYVLRLKQTETNVHPRDEIGDMKLWYTINFHGTNKQTGKTFSEGPAIMELSNLWWMIKK